MERSRDDRRPKLDWNVLFPATDDDDHPPQLLVVSSIQSTSNFKHSHVCEISNPLQPHVTSGLDKMSDRKLEDAIKRMEENINPLSRKLPDGGVKLKNRYKCFTDERKRRQLMRLQPDVSGCETSVLPKTLSSGEPHDLMQHDTLSVCNSMSRFGTLFSDKLDQNESKSNECTDASAFGSEMSLLKCSGPKPWSTEKHSKKKKKKFKISPQNFYSQSSESRSLVRDPDKNDRYLSLHNCSRNKSGNLEQKVSPVSEKRRKKFSRQSVELVDVVDSDNEDNKEEETRPSECFKDMKIFYPSRDDPEAVEILYADMTCLEPESFLSSTIMNFYIRYLQQKESRVTGEGHNYLFFNTYFYQKLKEAVSCKCDKDSFFTKFRRWWKGVSIFEKAYILIPINEDFHWSLVIVCILDKKDSKGPVILHLDSLGLHCSKSIFRHIKSYLKEEWSYLNREKCHSNDHTQKHVVERSPLQIEEQKISVPRQTNMYDCGLFVLFFIKRFIKVAPERLRRDDLAKVGKKMFKAGEASSMRGEIKELLENIFQKTAYQTDDPIINTTTP